MLVTEAYFEEEAEQSPGRLTVDDTSRMVTALVQELPHLDKPTDALSIGTLRWRPHLMSDEPREILHVHVVDRLGEHWQRRISAARGEDYKVYVAGPEAVWFQGQTLIHLASHAVAPIVIEQDDGIPSTVTLYRSVAELVAMRNLKLAPSTWLTIASRLFDEAIAEKDTYRKGWLFEDFLCLLFSQVSYFSLFSHNFHTATEEIDLVLRNHRVADGSFPSRPIVLVSAKNERDTGRPAFTDFEPKIANRRGQCELGFLCTSGRFASTVDAEALRASRGTAVIVLVDRSTLRGLLATPEQLDTEIERLFYEAALR